MEKKPPAVDDPTGCIDCDTLAHVAASARLSVEEGMRTDLLVLAADPTRNVKNFRQLRYVVKGGVVRAQAERRAAATSPR